MTVMIEVRGLTKRFTLHGQGGVSIPVFAGLGLSVDEGECLALDGPSGSGKSTLLRSLYANYRPEAGQILVRHDGGLVDMMAAPPHQVLAVRRTTLGYVSQFLRVIPRVPALAIVAEPLRIRGLDAAAADRQAMALLARLNIPERLWGLAPATFSGGEQQRVNLARGFIAGYPILLLDEPTASLDRANRQTVIELIREARQAGTAMVGIFHDREVRDAVADRLFPMSAGRAAA